MKECRACLVWPIRGANVLALVAALIGVTLVAPVQVWAVGLPRSSAQSQHEPQGQPPRQPEHQPQRQPQRRLPGPPPSPGQSRGQALAQYQGRRIADVLRELQTRGARIIFTSTLVRPDLLVKAEPRTTRPRQMAAEILAPHGLALQDGPGRTWLVVRAPVAAAVSRRPAASNVAPSSPLPPARQDPPAPVELTRVEERVDVTERLHDRSSDRRTVHSFRPSAVRETAGGLENVFQTMPTLPGVASTNDKDGKMAVRGAGPEHNTVMFDGVQMHSPQRFGDFPTSFLNPATAASVALDASGLDARYGGRLSSVMVLETRDGTTERRLAVSGSAGLTNGDILAEGRLPGTRSGSWWATARGTYYRLLTNPFGDGVVPSFADLQFKITLRPTSRTRLSLLGLAGQEAMLNPGLSARLRDATISGPEIDNQFDADTRLGAMNLWWTPSRRLTTVTTLTAYANTSRYQDNRVFDSPVFDRRVRIVDVAARQRALFAWSPRRSTPEASQHLLETGVEVRRLRSAWAMQGVTTPDWARAIGPDVWGELVEGGPVDVRLARTQIGGWMQDRIPLGPRLELAPGVRLDWNSFTGETAVQPRLRLTKRIGTASLWAGLAWQAQTPGHETMQQGFQYYDLGGPPAGGGAADLRNERSRQVVVGVERGIGHGLGLRVEAYHRAFDRLIVQRLETETERLARLAPYVLPPDLPPDSAVLEYRPTVHPESTGRGRASGIEALISRESGRVSGWLSYTLSKSERELYGSRVPFDFDRRHALAVVANVRLTRRIRLSATSHLASGFPVTPLVDEVIFNRVLNVNGPSDPFLRARRLSDGSLFKSKSGFPLRVSLLNAERLPVYARTDVRVTFATARRWEFYGEVINLFNRENFIQWVTWQDTSGLQRSEHDVYSSYPRFPTGGVRVKF